ncbi:hypothetical protein Xen7305DRAFT_00008660 [Xenococcus sp. PCC 7305]|uniref:hypothetical protein n=1 Tax=Xenococcus sp. PCC 7305 TaxID=102125 RepID=UPI0002AC3B5B|nr:hypothetical protein [Xenococcus sp. PCC 7305]ELS01164.1 hypothetical protein Xen7305DRAFT_00008660 [Xenococcus sp. PCC 7305]
MAISGNLKIKVSVNPGYLADQAMKQGLYDAYVDELLDVADEWQQESYVGATKDLKGGWDVIAPRRGSSTFAINAVIINTSDRAINRVAGRGPGATPPIAPLEDWVKAKGIASGKRALGVAIAISKTIAKRGTRRYQNQENFLDLNLDGTPKPGARIEQAQKTITQNLSKKFDAKNS